MKIITGAKTIAHELAIPPAAEIARQAARAHAAGFRLIGSGPIRTVAGGCCLHTVGPLGCTCPNGRCDFWCDHRSLLAVALGQVAPPAMDAAGNRRPIRKQRRGWLPRPALPKPLVPRFRMPDGSPTPMDRLRERNRALWDKAA